MRPIVALSDHRPFIDSRMKGRHSFCRTGNPSSDTVQTGAAGADQNGMDSRIMWIANGLSVNLNHVYYRIWIPVSICGFLRRILDEVRIRPCAFSSRIVLTTTERNIQ